MRIDYCVTDEAAMLAAHSFLPIVRAFATRIGIQVVSRDLSLGARILAAFPESSRNGLTVVPVLAELLAALDKGAANVVKLPGISATQSQLSAAIEELQGQGVAVPSYPDAPHGEREREIRQRYDGVLGSVVNATLRKGNSERTISAFVKAHARTRGHQNDEWCRTTRSHVSSMDVGDFRSTEQAYTLPQATRLRVEHVSTSGKVCVLCADINVSTGDVVDSSVMRRRALDRFFVRELESARRERLLFSLQLKSSSMRVSDPIILGRAVRAYYERACGAQGDLLDKLELRRGFDIVATAVLSNSDRTMLEHLVEAARALGPTLACDEPRSRSPRAGRQSIAGAMASAVRRGGRQFDSVGELRDTKFVIPDHAYADLYKVVFAECTVRGAFDPRTLGSASIVGLTAEAAQEYGSQDTTFEMTQPGLVRLVDERGALLSQHHVAAGDVWRLCRATSQAVEDWIGRAIACARARGEPVVFWLDAARPRDRELISRVSRALPAERSLDREVACMDIRAAAAFTFARLRSGGNVVAAVGNVLRDYLTELLAALEVGNSAAVQATTFLTNGGALFEAGSAGCAPRQFRDFLATNHLRWNSLGEIVALVGSLELVAQAGGNRHAFTLARALQHAGARVLAEGRVPSRKPGGLDTRGSHLYIARYWASIVAQDRELSARFSKLSHMLEEARGRIEHDLQEVQGAPVSLAGYYRPDPAKVAAVMRPSVLLNQALTTV